MRGIRAGSGCSTTCRSRSLERLAEVLEHREIAVDQGIEQSVGEIVGAERPHPRGVLTQPRAHRVEAVAGALLEGQDEVLADDQRQLLGPQAVVEVGHAQDDEQMLLVGLDLRALIGLDDVGEHQRVQAEAPADGAHDLEVAQPLDIDPGDREALRELFELADRGERPLLEPLGTVGDHLDAGRDRRLLRRRDQGPGRRAGGRPPGPAPAAPMLPRPPGHGALGTVVVWLLLMAWFSGPCGRPGSLVGRFAEARVRKRAEGRRAGTQRSLACRSSSSSR